MKEDEDLHSSYIANCVFNAFLSYTAIVLNSVTIHALRKTSSLPGPLKTLLLSLAASDLGVGLLVQPSFIGVNVILSEHKTEESQIYNKTNTAFLITLHIFESASFFGVMALSADRFLAIHFHLRYQELVTRERVVAVVISIWGFSVCLSLISLWIPKSIAYAIFAIIIASFFLITPLINYKIYVAVRRHANHIQTQQLQQVEQNGEMENAARRRKFAVASFFVYLVFLACYLPNTCRLVVFIIFGVNTTIKVLRLHTLTLVFINSSLNPLIFCWKLRHVRHAVMEILRNILRS